MALLLKRYARALTAVSLAMVAYFLTIVPWIEPGKRADYPVPQFTSVVSGDRWWSPLFPDSAWQREQPTVVHNSHGVLLARTWEQVDQKTWKLTPLSIVLTGQDIEQFGQPDAAGDDAVWVITAQQGATLHFDQPLDLKSGQVPSIQRGQLEGEIRIERLTLDAPSTPSLRLSTRNVSIDRRRIWTQEEVLVESSDLRLRGRVLRIGLLSDILSKQTDSLGATSTPRYGPLEEIELLQLTEFRLQLRPGGIWAQVSPDLLQWKQPIDALPARVEAECGGRFTFNFSKELATLTGGVGLRHQLGDLPPDEFQCHKLNLKLESLKPVPTDPSGSPAMPLQNLSVKEIEAFGIDSLEDFVGEMWVELKSPLADVTVRAKRMRLELSQQRIELAGKLDQPGATVSIAELNYRGFQVHAPLLEYQAAPRTSDGQAAHGGWLVAQGAGEAATPADSQFGETHLRWHESLKWAPAEARDTQWIELAGKTLIENRQQGYVTTDRLQMWVRRTDVGQTQGNPRGPGGYLPQRLQSLDQTVIVTHRLKASVGSVDLQFVYPPPDDATRPAELSLQDSAGNPLLDFLSPPAAGSGLTGETGLANRGAPIDFSGQSLQGTIASGERGTWLDSLTIGGPLSFKTTYGSALLPVELQGDSLGLTSTPEGEIDVAIDGQPAQVLIAQGAVRGPRIRFNQRENRIWIDQPGEFQLPPDSLNASLGGADGQWQLPLTCSWQQRMWFDGQQVELEGGIRLTGAVQQGESLWLLEGLSERLRIQLDQPVNFGQLERTQLSGNAAPISQISLHENVDLRVAEKNLQGERVSLERLLVPTLTIYVPQQKVVATGPGRGICKFISARNARGPSHVLGNATAPLQCAHLTFRDSLVALLDRSEVVADGNIQIITGPIDDWQQSIDPHSLTRLSLGQMSLTSDQVKLYDTSALNSTQSQRQAANPPQAPVLQAWEVQASGNVVLDGHTDNGEFTGSAYQVTYVQSKDLLTLRGDGRSKAMLQRRPHPQTTASFPTTIHVDTAVLNVRTMGVEQSQGLHVNVEFQSTPDTPLQRAAPNASTDPRSPPSPAPNPRDGIKNFLRGY